MTQAANGKSMHFTRIPRALCSLIFSFLPCEELLHPCLLVSRAWMECVGQPESLTYFEHPYMYWSSPEKQESELDTVRHLARLCPYWFSGRVKGMNDDVFTWMPHLRRLDVVKRLERLAITTSPCFFLDLPNAASHFGRLTSLTHDTCDNDIKEILHVVQDLSVLNNLCISGQLYRSGDADTTLLCHLPASLRKLVLQDYTYMLQRMNKTDKKKVLVTLNFARVGASFDNLSIISGGNFCRFVLQHLPKNIEYLCIHASCSLDSPNHFPDVQVITDYSYNNTDTIATAVPSFVWWPLPVAALPHLRSLSLSNVPLFPTTTTLTHPNNSPQPLLSRFEAEHMSRYIRLERLVICKSEHCPDEFLDTFGWRNRHDNNNTNNDGNMLAIFPNLKILVLPMPSAEQRCRWVTTEIAYDDVPLRSKWDEWLVHLQIIHKSRCQQSIIHPLCTNGGSEQPRQAQSAHWVHKSAIDHVKHRVVMAGADLKKLATAAATTTTTTTTRTLEATDGDDVHKICFLGYSSDALCDDKSVCFYPFAMGLPVTYSKASPDHAYLVGLVDDQPEDQWLVHLLTRRRVMVRFVC